jgi:hypothetical protein
MGKMNMVNKGKYIYCIVEAKAEVEYFGPFGIGGRGDEVYTISLDGIAAVVSDAPITKYSVARENLISHEFVIEEVMKSRTVLPVRFATIAESEDKVRRILEKEHPTFIQLLKYMENKKELGLKAVFKDIIYRDILANYDEIRIQKEKIEKGRPREFALIEIGRKVEVALEQEKEKCKQDILADLTPLALEVKISNTYGERMVINGAFLVDEAMEPLFDLKVRELGERYGERINFKYVGTPPFNFVDIEIDTRGY